MTTQHHHNFNPYLLVLWDTIFYAYTKDLQPLKIVSYFLYSYLVVATILQGQAYTSELGRAVLWMLT